MTSMDYIVFATVIIGCIVGVFGLCWTVFSGMLNKSSDDLQKNISSVSQQSKESNAEISARISELSAKIDKSIEERTRQVENLNVSIQHIRDEIKNHPSYEFLDKHMAKKEVVQIQLENILKKIDDVVCKIDDLKKHEK